MQPLLTSCLQGISNAKRARFEREANTGTCEFGTQVRKDPISPVCFIEREVAVASMDCAILFCSPSIQLTQEGRNWPTFQDKMVSPIVPDIPEHLRFLRIEDDVPQTVGQHQISVRMKGLRQWKFDQVVRNVNTVL